MGSKLMFVEAASEPGANVSALCREHCISRQTGHKWLKRFRKVGYAGLTELSRRPQSCPRMTGREVVESVLSMRERHPSWGPEKLVQLLRPILKEDCPSRTTVARLLKSAGKVRKRRARVRVWHVEQRPCVDVKAPNDLWTIDFKGWWLAKNGERCEPLTVRDAMSRMVLAVVAVAKTNGRTVRRVLERLFAKHGVPRAMLMDNGAPWINTRSRGGMTALSAWLVSLDIRLYRSRVGAPQDNGGHERMHRDLNELRLSAGRSRKAQQRLCDRWMLEFNHVRPHASHGGKTPAEVYGTPPCRPMATRLAVYPEGFVTRRVLSNGDITMNNDRVCIGRAFIGQRIGLRYEGGLCWRAYFYECDLGTVEIVDRAALTTEIAQAGTTPRRAAQG